MLFPEKLDDAERERFALSRAVVFQGVLILSGLLALFVLFMELEGFLSPLLVGVTGAILLWPLREHKVVRSMLMAGGLLLLLWGLNLIGEVLIPFAVVYVLAYLLDPAVSTAQRRWRVPRWASSLLMTLLAVGVIVLLIVLIVPNLIGRVEQLATGILASLSGLERWILESDLVAYFDESGLVERAELEAQVRTIVQEQLGALVATIPEALQTLLTSVSTLIALITTVTLVPVLLYYTLKDFPTIESALIGLFPTVDGRRDYLTRAAGIVGSYLRGQLTISAIGAVYVGVLLSIFGVPFAVLIGVLTGLLNMIPQIGAILTNVLGVLIALIFGAPIDALVVVLVLLSLSLLEQAVLAPNILSYQVGLHPVLIILSLLVFGATMGLLGLLIAVPLTALLVTFYKTYRETMTLELGGLSGSALIVAPEARRRPPPEAIAPSEDTDVPAGAEPSPRERS